MSLAGLGDAVAAVRLHHLVKRSLLSPFVFGSVQRFAETEEDKEERLEAARKKAFADKRKAHYNEMEVVKMGGLLGKTDFDEDEEDEAEGAEGAEVPFVEPKEGSVWQVVSSSTGDRYYFNPESGESTWDLPEGEAA